jgi:hypothetical protein
VQRRRADRRGVLARDRRPEPAEQNRGDGRGNELRHDVETSELRLDPPRDEEAGRDRGVEVPAGDVSDGGDHHRDREAVRKGDADDPSGDTGHDRADADEDERERADELGDRAASHVFRHDRNLRAGSDVISSVC